jgi:hypothetical protein
MYLKAKEDLWKLKYILFHHANILIFQKNPLKTKPKSVKILLFNSRTNLKFQHKPKYHLSKILR